MLNSVKRGYMETCIAIGTSRALACYLLAKYDEWGQLKTRKVDPVDYDSPVFVGYCAYGRRFALPERKLSAKRYFDDHSLCEIFRKMPLEGSDGSLHSAAVAEFLACEKACCLTNLRLANFAAANPSWDAASDGHLMNSFIGDCKKVISRVLGPLPCDLKVIMGSGATFHNKGEYKTLPDKFSGRTTMTPGISSLLNVGFWQSAWGRCHMPYVPVAVKGNRFVSIPKDEKKNRGICVEPAVNLSYQLSVGSHLKERLRRFAGIDLYNGQEKHRELARSASIDGSLATIDLSSASDTLAYQTVKLLLPEEWFTLLCSLRSPFTNLDGKWFKLEKFSSMGNGFTFELETLIFYAIARACGSLNPYVYGDDILVESRSASSVVTALKFFGFTPNKKKTFVAGSFRESCGGDFFAGFCVRAHQVKEPINEPQHLISLYNGLGRLVRTYSLNGWGHNPFGRFRSSLMASLPSSVRRCTGPCWLGDIVLHTNEYLFCTNEDGSITSDAVIPEYVYSYSPVQRVLPWSTWSSWPGAVLAAALYGVPSRGVMVGVSGFRVKKTYPRNIDPGLLVYGRSE